MYIVNVSTSNRVTVTAKHSAMSQFKTNGNMSDAVACRSFSLASPFCHIQLNSMHCLSLGDHRASLFFEPVQCHYQRRLPGATGRLNGIGMQPCVCVWVYGRQSVACLHFIFHSLGAVNLCPWPSPSCLDYICFFFSVFFLSCSVWFIPRIKWYTRSKWCCFFIVSGRRITSTSDIC